MTDVSIIADDRLTAPASGLTRQLRKLNLSVRRRLKPLDPLIIPFDSGLRIGVRPIDRLGRSVWLNGYSDREHAALLHAFLRPGMVYFDIGAHIGQFTLIAASRVGPTGQVHAFEPTRETFDVLESNIRLNGFEHVYANHAAIHSEPGELELQVCVRGKGEFNAFARPLRPDGEIVGTENVPTVTLDDYCAGRVEHIDLMKIDTNGAELQVLRGASNVLGSPQAPAIVCEFNDVTTGDLGYSTIELRAAFEDLGYGLFSLDGAQRRLVPEPRDTRYPDTRDVLAVKDVARFEQALVQSRG